MTRNKAALHRGNDNSAKMCHIKHDQIISDYERGTWWAGWLLFTMFMFMSLGSVMFGW